MLSGMWIKSLKRFYDERGFFAEIMRADWKDLLGEDEIVQVKFSMSYPGIVRAWHRHLEGQIDYFLVIKGSLKICAYDDETQELDEIFSSDQDLQLVRIPGHYWHGFKVVGNDTAFLIYFTTKLYDREKPARISVE